VRKTQPEPRFPRRGAVGTAGVTHL
jgi:hypothetical protein